MQGDKEPVKDWSDFAELAAKLTTPECTREILFRGEPRCYRETRPPLARQFPREQLEQGNASETLDFALQYEHQALMWFQEVAHAYLPKAILPPTLPHSPRHKLQGEKLHAWWKTACQWWAIMQHHGVPTRFLDWTRSIYVAAFFAVEDQLETDGYIWCCMKESLDRYMQKRYARKPYLSRLFRPIKKKKGQLQHEFDRRYRQNYENDDVFFLDMLHKLERHSIQQGCFLMCKNPLADVRALLKGAKCLWKIVIPTHQKPRFLHYLRTMNITRHTLFPGVDGLGRSIGHWISVQTRLRP